MGGVRDIRTFRARLSGRREVPPVVTNASGSAKFRFDACDNELRYRLVIRNISRVTQAHIHLGHRGQNGPIVAFLLKPTDVTISANVAVIRGVITRNDLVGPLWGHSIFRLIREIKRGNAYVNVHTVEHPDGEIRGQIRKVRC